MKHVSHLMVFYVLPSLNHSQCLSYLDSGSSSMMAEAVHSVVDGGNQALLLIGLRTSASAPDKTHQYGYGKSIYFWSLVSALGTFWMGAGVR